MQRVGFALSFCVLFLSVPSRANAQLSDSERQRLVADIEAAKSVLDADRFPDFQQSRTTVVQRIDAAKVFFRARTGSANAQAWIDYLDVEPLLRAIESDESPVSVGRAAQELRFRLLGTSPGLELRVIRELRVAVEELIDAVVFRDKERSLTVVARQLESLADQLRAIDANPTPEQTADLSAVSAVLKSSGQADEVIDSLRQTFDEPNIAVTVSEALLQQAIEQAVDETGPVRECILGTRIIGQANMRGRVTADLLPSDDSAYINVTLMGTVESRNTGYNGPVRLRTSGLGSVTATRAVILNGSGVHLANTFADASLSTEIQAIEHPLKLVRKIAWKQARQQKPQADRIALGRLRSQVRDQFAQQTSEAIDADSLDFDRAKRVLQRLSLEEPEQRWSSTSDALSLQAVFRRADQLASVTPRPVLDVSSDVAIQVHESAIDNALSPVLAGRTVRESELEDLLRQSGRPVGSMAESDGDDDEEDEAPFEIDFARLRPIIFEARQNSLRIGVRGTRFLQGGRELKQPMEITAVYVPVEGDGVVTLVRQGEVGVKFPGDGRLTMSQAGLRRTIQKKFSAVFPETLLDRPWEVPDDLEIPSLRGRVFRPRTVAAGDGWVTITVR